MAKHKLDEINQTLARSTDGPALASFGKPMIQTTFGASLKMHLPR